MSGGGDFAVLVRRFAGVAPRWELSSRHETLEEAERQAQDTPGAWVWWGSWEAAEKLMRGPGGDDAENDYGQGLGGG